MRSAPKAGDILVSERSARADVYEISVVPGETRLIAQRYDEAIEAARTIARHLRVDGWYTPDQTRYLAVATYRPSEGLDDQKREPQCDEEVAGP